MTREERNNAVKVLRNFDLNNPKVNSLLFSAEEITNAFDMAIKELEQEPILDKIRAGIESNMESIIGKYDSSIPKSNMPSYKIERNKVREECISIIDKYKAEQGAGE